MGTQFRKVIRGLISNKSAVILAENSFVDTFMSILL